MASLGAMLGSKGKMPMGKGDMGADDSGEEYSEPSDNPTEEGTEDVPPDFQAAYDDYTASPSAKGMYDMIEACHGASPGKGEGLALLLGGKGKK